ncbi:MraY family glycosyltransferase [Polaribacter sp. HaHaR_3_91]|uniref:MraY family glycosyltransferase n=1 Tax=unclassified Polaribacter TaxID=196858 RepID=UPI001C4FD6D1|nr:MraY family glycosyltransferase [Polaribacter sp. HaHaR_3_91]QXP62204.1 undecaprenyl/decaprenyl-phosphate alpha-N-acetylglucosaminyl 1-phosphate transferase [Polaribacter sp. HaHaR_3_91]
MLQQLLSNLTVVSILTVISSLLLVYYIIPKISWVIIRRNLNEKPNERSSHKGATPTMAGVAFFITLILMLFFIQHFDTENIGLNLIASTTLIFMVGVKDDLVVSSPKAKLFMEALAVLFLFFHNALEGNNLYGFLGIYEIPLWLVYIASTLLVLTIINAYNLIDGIDGLASIIAIIIFSVFSLIFYAISLFFYYLICLSFIGMLLAYLFFNFSIKKKIFMGDTGSLLIGFCIAFLSLRFMAIDISMYSHFTFKPENGFFVLMAILCIPLFDLLRVIGVRLLQKKSPFYPDRNHSHHVLIDFGMSHFKATMLLGLVNYLFVIFIIKLGTYLNSFQMLGVFVLAFGLFLLLFYRLKSSINTERLKIKEEKIESII